jgi:hypothetical protein
MTTIIALEDCVLMTIEAWKTLSPRPPLVTISLNGVVTVAMGGSLTATSRTRRSGGMKARRAPRLQAKHRRWGWASPQRPSGDRARRCARNLWTDAKDAPTRGKAREALHFP